MYMAIKFDDGRATFVKKVKDEGEIIREKKKWEEDYIVRQVATSRSGPGIIFLADKKKKRSKYIWE